LSPSAKDSGRPGVETPSDRPAGLGRASRGYDILSQEIDGCPRHVEVKAARAAGNRFSFFLTENERAKACILPNYYFYLVMGAESEPAQSEGLDGGPGHRGLPAAGHILSQPAAARPGSAFMSTSNQQLPSTMRRTHRQSIYVL